MTSIKAISIGCLLALAGGCGSSTGGATGIDAANNTMSTAQEGQACSVDPADDPQLVCSKVQGLVCIATFSRITDAVDGGVRRVFLCRMPCTGGGKCPQPGDVCCPGEVRSGGQASRGSACVPTSSCESSAL
jgi:hypothetical protein